MFQSARIKFTVWYALISMIISVLFSMTIYTILDQQLTFNSRRMELRIQRERELNPDFNFPNIPEPRRELKGIENSIRLHLFYVNLMIFLLSSVGGYLLAGRTLKPIKESVEKQNQFIADASHELRTPLTALRTSIEVNLRDKKLDMRQAKSVLKDNLEDVDKLKNLSNNLLTLATLQGVTDRPKNKLSLQEVVDAAVKNILQVAKNKNIKIRQNIIDVTVRGDRTRLVELFNIFLDNAVKYSPKNTTVSLTSKLTDSTAILYIKDQGIGIGKKDLSHIFERFYRADKSRSNINTDGYGLGLAIAKEILAFHKGSVTVESEEKKGTTFIIKLPVEK